MSDRLINWFFSGGEGLEWVAQRGNGVGVMSLRTNNVSWGTQLNAFVTAFPAVALNIVCNVSKYLRRFVYTFQ